MPDLPRFPADLAACHALLAEREVAIRTHELTIVGMSEQLATAKETIVEKQLMIDELLRRSFQKRAERYLENPAQLQLDFGDSPEVTNAAEGLADAIDDSKQAADEAAAAADQVLVPEHTRRRHVPRKRRNEQLPAHLPRYEVDAPIADDAKFCPTHGEKKLIGYDWQESLEFIPPKLQVRKTRIAKFACVDRSRESCKPNREAPLDSAPQTAQPTTTPTVTFTTPPSECGVTEATRPVGLVEGNKYDTSVAAEIVSAKFGYHLPIYRQQDLFASSGWTPSRGTLLNIAEAAHELLPPFMEYLRDEVRRDFAIGTDETRVTLLLPPGGYIPLAGETLKSRRIHEVFAAARKEQKPSVTARMWAYRGVEVPINVFDFTVSRHRDGPDEFLVDAQFTGTLLGDCYSGFQGLALRSDSRIVRAACNAHARRKFFDAKDNHPLLANQFLALYQQLYDIEDRGRALSTADRQSLRAAEAAPLWKKMDELLDGPVAKHVLPKEKIGEAVGYLRNQSAALRAYLADGHVPFDNNLVEQLMKQVALGRKNWLFIGSIAAGARAADFLTLISSALRNDLDTFTYMKSVFDTLLSGSTDYASLRPNVWAKTHPEAIRQYRREERRVRTLRKSTRRAARRR